MAHRRWTATVIGALVMLGAGSAWAQEPAAAFGSQRGVAITAERLFGFLYVNETQTTAGVDRTSHVTSISLIGNSLSLLTLYAQPRLAADWFPIERLSVGASATYSRASTSIDAPAGTTTSTPTYTAYIIAPRVGYALPISPIVSLWPRVGFTYAHLGFESTNGGINGNTTTTSGQSLYAVTIEAPFVFVIAPHLFLSLAPTVDLGVGGSNSATATSTSLKETDFGLLAGLGGYL
jgi:hypothetical protein